MKHADMTKRYSSLLTGATRLRRIMNCAVILMLGLTVCTAHAIKPDQPVARNNAAADNDGKKRASVRKPGMKQMDAAAKASKSGVRTLWNSRLGTPSSVRGINLGKKFSFSKAKGLALQGKGAHKRNAVAVLDNLSELYQFKDVENEVVAERVDADALGYHHVRVKQAYKGLKVFGADLIVHFNDNDEAYEVNGQYVPEIDVDIVPAITAAEAVQAAQKQLRSLNLAAGKLAADPELVIYACNADPVLAYEFLLLNSSKLEGPGEWRFWINAATGEILLYYNDIKHIELPFNSPVPATISGNLLEGEGGAYTNVQGLAADNHYYLSSLSRKWSVYNVASSGYPDANTYAYRNTNDWATSDTTEMSAAWNYDLIQKYYSQVHGRNSYDNKGAIAVANVHEGVKYANAYWTSSYQQFYFGDGDGESADSLAVLDICAHEFTHAVTEYSANLIYSYESGAINESFSDIFGACAEFSSQPDGRDNYPDSNPGEADWLIGEDCWLETPALRDMRNPANFMTVGFGGMQPTRYQGNYWYFGALDNGGVHLNNSVQSFFFYLLCEGGFGFNEGIYYDLTGIGIENAEQIAYRALTVYCTPSTDYVDARAAWVSAAEDLSIDWAYAVRKAWNAVGVPAPPLLQLSSTGALPRGREWAEYSYDIGVFSDTTNCFWFLTEGSLPVGLNLDERSGIISGMPTLASTTYFDVVVTNFYDEAFTNSYSIEILPVHTAPFEENFDETEIIRGIPEFWTQETIENAAYWTAAQSLSDLHPGAPYSPTNFMSLFVPDYNDNVTRLVSPRIDFGLDARAGRLTFYHYMERWLYNTDELRVYYKTAMNGEWQLLETYTAGVSQWTQRVIELPAVSREVYIAFEGTAHYGYGIGVDSVEVYDPTPPYAFVTPELLPNAVIGEAYQTTLVAEGGYEPYYFSVVSNSLPAGITLSSDGMISGTGTVVESKQFNVQVMDAYGQILVKTYSLTVTEPIVNLFEEDFDHNGQMPYGWTQEYVEFTTKWTAESGGYNGNPIAAHEGTYNARLFAAGAPLPDGSYETHVTRLVSPKINLGQAPENVTLYFWHHMEQYGDDLDGLKVLYRTSVDGEWIELAEFTENTPEWTQRSMILPDPTADYYIAFEGYARYGYGICIDTLRITDESLSPVISTEYVLPDGLIGFEYEVQMQALGGIQPYTWSLVEGTLPNGMTFSPDGLLSGTPTEEYFDDFKVQVFGFDGQSSINAFNLRIRSVPSVPFFEDFEEGGAMPRAWTQEIVNGSVDWVIATGTAATTSPRNPTTAYSGTYNASLFSNSSSHSPAKTKLITPMLDLGGGMTNAVLKFHHFMAEWLHDQDYLKVYSRTEIGGPWTLLAEYKENTPSWTERSLVLTNLSSTFFIAFEAWGQYGYGVCVDDVSIDGDAPDPYGDWLTVNFTPEQISTGVGIGYYEDPDDDGILNIWEYAYLLDPMIYNYSGTPTGGVSDAKLQLVYRQNKDATDLTFVVEACTDLILGDWSTNGVSEFSRVDNGDWWEVVAQHDVPVTNAPTRFMRLKLLID